MNNEQIFELVSKVVAEQEEAYEDVFALSVVWSHHRRVFSFSGVGARRTLAAIGRQFIKAESEECFFDILKTMIVVPRTMVFVPNEPNYEITFPEVELP